MQASNILIFYLNKFNALSVDDFNEKFGNLFDCSFEI